MQRNILRKLFLGAIALLLIVVACLLFVLPSAHVLASSSRAVDIPTPDTTAVVNSANDAVSRAQDILSIVNVYATILGVVLTLFSLAAAALAFLGFRNYREVLSLAQDLRASMADIRTEGHKTREALVYLGLGDRLLNQKNTTEALQTYALAIKETPGAVQFEGVLDNLHLLQKAPQAMPGLDSIVKMIEDAKEQIKSEQRQTEKRIFNKIIF